MSLGAEEGVSAEEDIGFAGPEGQKRTQNPAEMKKGSPLAAGLGSGKICEVQRVMHVS